MAEPVDKRLTALLAESKKLARARKRRLSPAARAELAAIHTGVEEALASGDAARIEVAARSLEEAFALHLAGFRKSRLRAWAEVVVVAAAAAVLFRAFVGEAVRLDTSEMAPSLLPGDTVWVFKLPYRFGGGVPSRGEVLLVEGIDGRPSVRRVIGLPGETVEIVDRAVHVDGAPLPRRLVQERFEFWSRRSELDVWYPRTGSVWIEGEPGKEHATLASRSPTARPAQGPVRVPPGHVFVMGDNRDESAGLDSGEGALVPIASIRGRVGRVLFSRGPGPRSDWGEEEMRWDRLFAAPDGRRIAAAQQGRGRQAHGE